MRHRSLLAILLAVLACLPAWAAEEPPKEGGKGKPAAEKEKEKPKEPQDKLAETHGSVRIGGAEIRYTTTAGNLVMRDEDGKAKANIYFTAYVKDGEDPARRPITFAFNGGPGSSSVWLHLGAFGPRRVKLQDDGTAPAPPWELENNEQSLLDLTDLVFIDPVTTGFSRAVPTDKDAPFHGVRQDVESVGDFIRLYATRFGRWASPKFLAGESYGTTRAAGLSGYLQRRHGMYLSGIVLVSAILDFSTSDFNPGNDLPYRLFLPTYTAAAWYHKRLPADLEGDLQKALRESEGFARGEYAAALEQGDRLPDAERGRVLDELARLTGLDRDELQLHRLRILDEWFYEELLHKQGMRIGRLDARFKAPSVPDGGGDTLEGDPSYDNIQGVFTAMANDYLRRTLRYESDLPYEILTGRVWPWSFKGYENRYVNVAVTLAGAMHQNPALRVFVANGFYDFATPYFATAYTFDHMGLTPAERARVAMGYYQAGHMMYIDRPSRERLKKGLTDFYRSALPGK